MLYEQNSFFILLYVDLSNVKLLCYVCVCVRGGRTLLAVTEEDNRFMGSSYLATQVGYLASHILNENYSLYL